MDDEGVIYGPYEYYHNERDEPMFRQWKVRNIFPLFVKEDGHSDFTLEQFKDWFKRAINEEDWTYIHKWGGLEEFDTSTINNNEIYEYLFQLGMNPDTIYMFCLRTIDSCKNRLKDPNCKYKEYITSRLNRKKELLDICEKYISEGDKRIAIELKDTVELY
jgi:hypothetical protein